MINNDDDKERAAGGGKQQRRSATELDVAAICKIVTQPSNEKELDFVQQILTYIDEKGGPNVILQQCQRSSGAISDNDCDDNDDDSIQHGKKRGNLTMKSSSSPLSSSSCSDEFIARFEIKSYNYQW